MHPLTPGEAARYIKRMPIDRELLEDLVCPACRGTVSEQAADHGIECAGCGRVYPVRDGIPVMLVDQAIEPRESPQTE